jgi:hypothetical protein
MNQPNETRTVMARLARLAEQYRCAIVVVRHLRKGNADKAIYRGAGSIDFTGACRSVLLVGADPDDESRRAVFHIKANLSEKAEPLAFEIRDGQFRWAGASKLTLARVLGAATDTEERNARSDAEDFLLTLLASGPLPTKEVKRAAKDAGISDITLRRAKDSLGVRARKHGGYFGGVATWSWGLAEDADDSNEHAQKTSDEHLQRNDAAKDFNSGSLPEDAHNSICEHVQAPDEHVQVPDGHLQSEDGHDSFLSDLGLILGIHEQDGA